MFDKEQFIADCRRAATEGQQAVGELVREAEAHYVAYEHAQVATRRGANS